ncbi:MAG: class I fructose-bisphosphate aldolase, partial [Candidatus Rokuibacteriota bacterium]
LQGAAMAAWKGDPAGVPRGQKAFGQRARCTGAARDGRYTPALEHAVA